MVRRGGIRPQRTFLKISQSIAVGIYIRHFRTEKHPFRPRIRKMKGHRRAGAGERPADGQPASGCERSRRFQGVLFPHRSRKRDIKDFRCEYRHRAVFIWLGKRRCAVRKPEAQQPGRCHGRKRIRAVDRLIAIGYPVSIRIRPGQEVPSEKHSAIELFFPYIAHPIAVRIQHRRRGGTGKQPDAARRSS